MKTSIGDQTLKYFIMILLKGPDNPCIFSNSVIHINFNNMDATAPLFIWELSTSVTNKVAPTLKCGGGSNLQGISGSPGTRDETETLSSLFSVSIYTMANQNMNARGCSLLPIQNLDLTISNYFTKGNKLFYLIWSNPNPNKDKLCVKMFYSDGIFFNPNPNKNNVCVNVFYSDRIFFSIS